MRPAPVLRNGPRRDGGGAAPSAPDAGAREWQARHSWDIEAPAGRDAEPDEDS